MRVLWLTPTQLPAVRGAPPTGLGWIEGLRRALEIFQAHVDLTIASWGPVQHAPFRMGNTQYWCIRHGDEGRRAVELLHRWRHGVVPGGAVKECVRIVLATRPDIIHVHGSESFLGLTLPEVTVPGVISLQGIASALQTHWFDGLTARDLGQALLDPAFAHGYGLFHDFARISARAESELTILQGCDDYLGRTDWDRSVLAYLRPGARYHHVDEVLNSLCYAEEWDASGSEGNVVYTTSGSRPVKGLETLLDAVALLRTAERPDIRLRVAGGVENGPMWPVIRRRLKDPSLAGAVELLGVLSPDAIVQELKRASVFANPSHNDNSPNGLCEALLVGVPCVASYVGGVPSLVRHGETGLLYHDRDPYMLAEAIDRLLQDRELAARLGQAARAAALVRHDPESIAAALVDAYRHVLASASG